MIGFRAGAWVDGGYDYLMVSPLDRTFVEILLRDIIGRWILTVIGESRPRSRSGWGRGRGQVGVEVGATYRPSDILL